MRKSLGEQGPALDAGIASLEEEFGIQLPDDLAVLLGDNLVAALDGERSDGLDVGARVTHRRGGGAGRAGQARAGAAQLGRATCRCAARRTAT